ncbi:substrate-binding domain-containing protein [Flavobacterium gilvum]|uniref:LacI family transcriptional regulator n=1 Tax=Flavobacterium gilvum TaxID=1492737 RepID=A0AAC9I819_9FLAO|nr:substrate-binding domain-containing protein [Flavobacterium gilvum]AOW10613.1 LacI family transcriptional regulator [Flavobacterium gilvum]KFC58156.1 LacI-family transcriptional regulator [Flavobacterium gilvum]
MDKKYTIKDIAQMAGVSKGTVDRVLHKRGKVSEEALKKINEVLDVINYEPNLIARNLKNNKVYRICILLPDPELDPYWQPCIKGIEDAVQEFRAYNFAIETLFFNPESKKSFLKVNEKVLEIAPDAVLLPPLFHKETIEAVNKYEEKNIIVNTFNNQVQSDSVKGFVGQDLIKSGRVAAKLLDLLLKKGQIVVIHIDESIKNAIHMQEKERGFREYFDEKENQDYTVTTLKLKSPNVEISLVNFLTENPDLSGIFISTSKAYQIAKVISGTSNKKIAVIGYDLVDNNVNYLNQGVIDFLIHQNQKRQAYLGVASIIEYFLFDKPIQSRTFLPIDIVNSENVSNYIE